MFTNDKCSIILPKENLISKRDNELYYYEKMADELIRYNRIKTFIFQPQSYLSFEQLKYNLREDEMLILQSLLTDEFFENLIPSDINRYAKNNTFDNTEPIITQPYVNTISIDETINPNQVRDCFPSNPQKFTTAKWKKCFPTNYKDMEYKGSNHCAIYLFIDIMNKVHKTELTVNEIKDTLFEEYKKITQNFKKQLVDKVADILIEQGKVDEGNQLKFGTLHILEMIMSEGYYLTNFDLWILLSKYKIQSIFLSSYRIPESRYNDFHFTCYAEPEESEPSSEFVFIVVPAIREDKSDLTYKVLVNNDNNIQIDINMLVGEECKEKIQESIENHITIEEYIESFKRDKKTKYKQRKPGVRTKIIPEFEVVVEEENKSPTSLINEEPLPPVLEPVKRKRVKKIKPLLVLNEEPIVNIEDDETKETEKDKEISPVFRQIEPISIEDQTKVKKNKKQRTKKAQIVKTKATTTAKGNKKTKKNKTLEPELILVTQDTTI
jgi:hypothetical protein